LKPEDEIFWSFWRLLDRNHAKGKQWQREGSRDGSYKGDNASSEPESTALETELG
jgi:hypothetical protein